MALAAAFLANEAVLGGALVLLDYVGQGKSAGRVLFLCLHFGNTLLLLATLSLEWQRQFYINPKPTTGKCCCGWLACNDGHWNHWCHICSRRHALSCNVATPSVSQDFSRGASALLHFRLFHPPVAVIAACYLLWIVFTTSTRRSCVSHREIALIIVLVSQVGIGMMNVLLLVPVWLQILHLLVADVLWILLVLVSAELVLERRNALPAWVVANPA